MLRCGVMCSMVQEARLRQSRVNADMGPLDTCACGRWVNGDKVIKGVVSVRIRSHIDVSVLLTS